MGLPPQLVSWGLDCRQRLQCRRVQRSLLSVRGLGGAQDICAISVFRSPWPIYPSLSLPLSSHMRGSGVHHFHQFGRVHLRIPILQVNYSWLKNFGKSTSRILRSGGTQTRGIPYHLTLGIRWQGKHFGYMAGQLHHG